MANFDFISYVLLPGLIFVARVADVAVGTVKLMFVVNNAKRVAALLGFVESLITIVALSRIMQDASNWLAYVMYAAGFATGTFVGMSIEEKLAYGTVMVRVISRTISEELLDYLTRNQYRYSMVDANDHAGNTQVLFTVCKRSRLPEFQRTLEEVAPQALYTIEGVKKVSQDYLPVEEKTPQADWASFACLPRKKQKAVVSV